ncbi:MAG: hypothetical protein WCF84_19765 [Anaerolineae bacterium]
MTYIETNRTTEPHSESILYLNLKDANGAPVANAKIKIWAGPLPTGQPPYFTDDDPNNPNRRTNAGGQFEWAVANGAPERDTDFFVQVVGSDNTPQSEPFHFPFRSQQAQWITVTAAPEGAGASAGGGIPPIPDLQLDPRLASELNAGVKIIQPTANATCWKLISAQYIDAEQAGGKITIVCNVEDEQGHPLAGVPVIQGWPSDQAIGNSNADGLVEFPMSGDSSFDPARGEHGPYSVLVGGLPSDTVVGLGLPLKRHVQFVLTWRRVVPGAPHEPTPPPPASSAVTGQIRNAPAGTQITLSGAGKTLNATIGPDGMYRFASLAAGTYALTLSGAGIINGSIPLDGVQSVVFDYAVPFVPRPPSKVFVHYLLFGPGSQPGTTTNLILALDYIVRFAPIVGFSPDEARNAQRVTIVGDMTAVSAAVEQGLRDEGCTVVRLTAADSYALENVFKQLVASGSPYPR